MRRNLPGLFAVGSVDRIRDIVFTKTSGAPIAPLAQAPRELPIKPGAVYFEINADAQEWAHVSQSAAIALHISQAPPGFEMELWAIRGAKG